MNRSQRGSATLEFLLFLGAALFPVCFLISVMAWPERLNAANAAAYEAAKTVTEAPDPAAAMADGRDRALEVIANHGFDASDVTVTFTPADPRRGDVVEASVTVLLPALTFPGVGSWDSVHQAKTHSERVGDFRGFE